MTRQEVVAQARRWIGTPYHHQAALRGVGCDCIGFIRGLHAELRGGVPVAVPAYRVDWAEMSTNEQLLLALSCHLRVGVSSRLLSGDVLAFRWRPQTPARHVALLSTPHSMIHVLGGGYVREVVFSPAWQKRLVAVFSFPWIVEE